MSHYCKYGNTCEFNSLEECKKEWLKRDMYTVFNTLRYCFEILDETDISKKQFNDSIEYWNYFVKEITNSDNDLDFISLVNEKVIELISCFNNGVKNNLLILEINNLLK